jgi:hypothetical protein
METREMTTKSPIDAANETYAAIVKSLTDLQEKFELPAAARDFVKQSTASAKTHATEMHAGAHKVAGAIEEVLTNAVSGVSAVNRKVLEAAHEDAQAALAAIEKITHAKSVPEAFQFHLDYLRERAEVGVARSKDVAEFVSAKAADGVKTMQDGIAKVATFAGKQAA